MAAAPGETVKALPRIIATLQAEGYRFVPVSTLAGLTRDDVMPQVSGLDLLAVRADVASSRAWRRRSTVWTGYSSSPSRSAWRGRWA
jgi:hypothetical protein